MAEVTQSVFVIEQDAVEPRFEIGNRRPPPGQDWLEHLTALDTLSRCWRPRQQIDCRHVGDKLVRIGSPREFSRMKIVDRLEQMKTKRDGLELFPIFDVELDASTDFTPVFAELRPKTRHSKSDGGQTEFAETRHQPFGTEPRSADEMERTGRAASFRKRRRLHETEPGIERGSLERRHVGAWRHPWQTGDISPIPTSPPPAGNNGQLELRIPFTVEQERDLSQCQAVTHRRRQL